MLKVSNVSKKYGDLLAVDNLSFEVNDGEIFGLLGLNGAGKTTTFRMILGLIDDYTGNITLDGKKIDYSITDKIGFLTEERSLLTKLTVLEQITYYGVLKSIPIDEIEKRLDYWLEVFGISEYKNKKIKELSKGNQQKIQFISAIINEPKLLILDEPFSGLDPINVELFKKVILEFKDKGTSIIFSSHRMEHVELFCDRLVVLVKGKSVISGYLKDIKRDYKKKNIYVKGDIDVDKIKKCKGVEDIRLEKDEYIISISDEKYTSTLFKEISKFDNIYKFSVEDPSLNEIFISTVGDSYEK
ncbi:MAG: ABC transporter ATP-binding protein [Bacilli bacterium]